MIEKYINQKVIEKLKIENEAVLKNYYENAQQSINNQDILQFILEYQNYEIFEQGMIKSQEIVTN